MTSQWTNFKEFFLVPTTEPYAARFIALCFEKSYASMYMTILGFLQLKTCKNGFSLPYRAKKKYTQPFPNLTEKDFRRKCPK